MLPCPLADLDGTDHALKVGRQRVEVGKQCAVDTLLERTESIIDAMAQPRMGARGVPPPCNGAELVLEKMNG